MSGIWRLKPGIVIPTEQELLKQITPEFWCIYESCIVGHQRLKDAGYAVDGEEDENEEDPESHLEVEEQLAPWVVTKNFIMATQAKAMLQLHGPGDPTGCGEGFSFIRQNMKELFFREGTGEEEKEALRKARENDKVRYKSVFLDQRKVYESEIRRVWSTQLRSLRSTKEPKLKDREDEDSMRIEKEVRVRLFSDLCD